MRPLSEATSRIAGKSFERKYIALGRIVNHWNDIVGAALAHKTQPIKIHYRKKEKQKSPDAMLEIAASSADATLLHYQSDLILERINQIFGERWITSVKFVSAPLHSPLARRKRARPTLTADKKKHLSEMLQTIADDDIKLRLEQLGQAVMMEEAQ